jgi:hypothetical protein
MASDLSAENTQTVLNTEQATEAHAGAFDLAVKVKVTDRNQNISRNAEFTIWLTQCGYIAGITRASF